jgi:antitoxin (DNA-binding transcriptional repressor) of toxin-antitoxin stability system
MVGGFRRRRRPVLVRSVEEADENFSELLAEVKRGETVLLTQDDHPVAEVRPVARAAEDRTNDPAWRAAYEELCAVLDAIPDDGYRVGTIAEEDKRGPSRW